ncbi:MAG TPA: BTAD domain-containing putative transcriptional regulator [Actinomycetes bacterium]|jgi:DNA-binding SARP family transcriptional activator|nr:BTAD domain-containing putative transcriptional regulator [Actinomycetes bacterium]
MTTPVDFLLLGPLEARQAGRPLRLGSIKHRILLAKLLLHANQVVSTDELIDTVWGEQPPATVRQSLQNHVASLRRAIESCGEPTGPPRMLRTRDPGYLLQLDPEQLDLRRFRRLLDEGRGALAVGEPATAVRLLHEALSLWRGPVLADVVAAGGAWPELVGIDEERVAALEVRLEADLALGLHLELIGELEGLIRQHPLREQLHGQLMLALYRSGRQADALAAYRAARRVLVDELGIEPGLRLQRLEQAILAQDPALELLGPAATGDEPSAAGEQAHGSARPVRAGEPSGAERKLVTVLFAEVDEPPAEQGERDPEDVSSMLERNLERVHTEISGFGGVVEHAIGGTIMAVFGVPHTREDDPERAVRTALAIRDALSGGVEMRIAVATGEALVTPGAGSTRVAGDLVSICARLQQAAPPGSVLVSEATERATSRVISYGPASLLSLPGRAKPVSVWSALEPRNRTGLEALTAWPVPLVARSREFGELLGAFERARVTGSPQLVTLIGPPGIGKTRLVAELWQSLEADRDLIAWRQGRSPPYGEGITFWALGEIVKAEAGILESDSADRVDRKLAHAASYALAGIPDASAWVTAQLRLLVGGSDERAQPRAGRQEEAFAAWRRFLHGLAARRPLVLVVEDLHWADDTLLEFLESLLDRTGSPPGSIPLLLVVTTRPELLERRPGWGGGPAATTVNLEPLSQDDTVRLLGALLAHHRLPSAIGPHLAATVGGNPLFAEEYVRMLRDRGLRAGELDASDADALAAGGRPELPLPETVHAIVAARLDALSATEKTVLHDAAVLGRVSWAGALAAVGGHGREIMQFCLDRLEAREFLYRAKRSSVAGEREYGFRHVLIRDVAYGQIPRAERADKHRRAAAWLESLSADRVEERPERRGAARAELLAHHYGRALAFARAAGQPSDDLARRTRLALRDAGDRVTALGVHVTAARYYARALELWPQQDPERAALEFRAGRARYHSEGTGGEELLTRARDGLLATGDTERAAEAEILLGQLAWEYGQRGPGEHVERALALVKDSPPSRSKANVLRGCMMYAMVAERSDEAIVLARRLLQMAVELGLRDIEAATLEIMGVAKVQRGDPDGVADLERSIQLSEQQLPFLNPAGSYINLATALETLGDLSRRFAHHAAAERAAERHGAAHRLRWLELERVAEHYWSGRWDEAVRKVDAIALESAGGNGHVLECKCRAWRGRIRLARGETAAAVADSSAALELARASGVPQNLDPALAFAIRAMLAADRPDDAAPLLEELLKAVDGRLLRAEVGIDLPLAMVELDYPVEALDGVLPSRWREAACALVAGDARRAAQLYAAIGSRPDAAAAHLVAARQLLAAGQPSAGRSALAAALGFYREVRASAYLQEAEDLLLALV